MDIPTSPPTLDSLQSQIVDIRGDIQYLMDRRILQQDIVHDSIKSWHIESITWNQGFGGSLTLGGANNVNGLLSVLDSTSTEKVRIDNTGITVTTGKITIKDSSNTTILDSTGLVSTNNFLNGSITDSNAFTTASGSFVDVTNMTLTFTLTRTANVLIGASVVGSNDSADGNGTYTALTQIVVDGTQKGGFMATPGISVISGILYTTGATSTIVSLAAGSHTIKLQTRQGGGGTARLVGSNPKTLWYVILGS